MVILLVACTFLLLIGLGMVLERRENRVRERAAGLHHMASPVFAQDGGEPVDDTVEQTESEESNS